MSWSKILVPLFVVINQGLFYFQNDYTVTTERYEVKYVNPDYADGRIHNIMYNRSTRAANITLVFRKDFGNTLEAAAQGYKFASNEYRLFPIVLRVNLCDVIKQDTFGSQLIYACGNFTKCPFEKGTYIICNFAPDESKLPPYHPRGRFMAEIKMYYRNIVIAELRWYTKVEDKIRWN